MIPFLQVIKIALFNSFFALIYFIFGLCIFFSTVLDKTGSRTIVPNDIGLWLYTLPWSLLTEWKHINLSWEKYLVYFVSLLLNTAILYFVGFFLTKWLGVLWQGVISVGVILSTILIFFFVFQS